MEEDAHCKILICKIKIKSHHSSGYGSSPRHESWETIKNQLFWIKDDTQRRDT